MIGGGLVNRKINGDQSHVKQIGGISSAAISLDRLRRVYVTSALSVLASTPEAIDGLESRRDDRAMALLQRRGHPQLSRRLTPKCDRLGL